MFLFALLAGTVGAQDVKVTASVAPEEVTVGERFAVELRASGPEGTTWTFPEEALVDGVELRLLPADPQQPASIRSYEGAAFALEDVAVPAMTVAYRLPDGTQGEAHSEPVPMRITSLLPKEADQQGLVDIRDPVGLPLGAYFWVLVGGAVALIAAVFLLIRRRRRRDAPPQAPAFPATPPDQEALAALDRLATAGYLERGELRAYYIDLAEIAKRYLERRLEAPVLEMTSTETVAFLRDGNATRDLVSLMRDLTGAADLVKFARGQGEIELARRQLEATRGLVATLERVLAPAPDPETLEKTA